MQHLSLQISCTLSCLQPSFYLVQNFYMKLGSFVIIQCTNENIFQVYYMYIINRLDKCLHTKCQLQQKKLSLPICLLSSSGGSSYPDVMGVAKCKCNYNKKQFGCDVGIVTPTNVRSEHNNVAAFGRSGKNGLLPFEKTIEQMKSTMSLAPKTKAFAKLEDESVELQVYKSYESCYTTENACPSPV